MKLCWDNIENVRLNRNGDFSDIIKKQTYYLKVCEGCGEDFLGRRERKFCCGSCSKRGENHPFYGKHHTEEARNKISEGNSGENSPMYGKHPSEETIKKLVETRKGEKSHQWKGGYCSKGIPTYDTYASQLKFCEDVRRNESDPNILEVKCTHCGKWYIPQKWSVRNRINVLKSIKRYKGEHRFYCSEECKHACSIYGKSPEQLMKQDAIRAGRLPWIELEREMQPELREMVLERDEYTCVKCGSTEKLHCHHIDPVATNPIESADVDNCVTLCENCHKKVHKLPGCSYGEIRMNVC